MIFLSFFIWGYHVFDFLQIGAKYIFCHANNIMFSNTYDVGSKDDVYTLYVLNFSAKYQQKENKFLISW